MSKLVSLSPLDAHREALLMKILPRCRSCDVVGCSDLAIWLLAIRRRIPCSACQSSRQPYGWGHLEPYSARFSVHFGALSTILIFANSTALWLCMLPTVSTITKRRCFDVHYQSLQLALDLLASSDFCHLRTYTTEPSTKSPLWPLLSCLPAFTP